MKGLSGARPFAARNWEYRTQSDNYCWIAIALSRTRTFGRSRETLSQGKAAL